MGTLAGHNKAAIDLRKIKSNFSRNRVRMKISQVKFFKHLRNSHEKFQISQVSNFSIPFAKQF